MSSRRRSHSICCRSGLCCRQTHSRRWLALLRLRLWLMQRMLMLLLLTRRRLLDILNLMCCRWQVIRRISDTIGRITQSQLFVGLLSARVRWWRLGLPMSINGHGVCSGHRCGYSRRRHSVTKQIIIGILLLLALCRQHHTFSTARDYVAASTTTIDRWRRLLRWCNIIGIMGGTGTG